MAGDLRHHGAHYDVIVMVQRIRDIMYVYVYLYVCICMYVHMRMYVRVCEYRESLA